jgi:hypothetical protein
MRNATGKICKEIKTHILCSVNFFFKFAEKCCRAGQAINGNMAHVHCMLDTLGYKYTPTVRNTYCFSTATMVSRTRLNATLYAHRLSSLTLALH